MNESRSDLNEAGLAAFDRGDRLEASRLWHEAASFGNAHSMRNLGLDCEDDGDIDGAIVWFEKAIDEGNVSACIDLGNVYLGMEDWDRAREAFLIGARQGDSDAMFWMSSVGYRRGVLEDGEEWLERAADTGHLRALLEVARRAGVRGHKSLASQCWTRAAEIGSFRACSELASSAVVDERQEDVIRWVERALAAPDVHEADDTEVWCLHGMKGSALEILGRYQDAIDTLRQAISLPHAEVDGTDMEGQIARLERHVATYSQIETPQSSRLASSAWRGAGQSTCAACSSPFDASMSYCPMCGKPRHQ